MDLSRGAGPWLVPANHLGRTRPPTPLTAAVTVPPRPAVHDQRALMLWTSGFGRVRPARPPIAQLFASRQADMGEFWNLVNEIRDQAVNFLEGIAIHQMLSVQGCTSFGVTFSIANETGRPLSIFVSIWSSANLRSHHERICAPDELRCRCRSERATGNCFPGSFHVAYLSRQARNKP